MAKVRVQAHPRKESWDFRSLPGTCSPSPAQRALKGEERKFRDKAVPLSAVDHHTEKKASGLSKLGMGQSDQICTFRKNLSAAGWRLVGRKRGQEAEKFFSNLTRWMMGERCFICLAQTLSWHMHHFHLPPSGSPPERAAHRTQLPLDRYISLLTAPGFHTWTWAMEQA